MQININKSRTQINKYRKKIPKTHLFYSKIYFTVIRRVLFCLLSKRRVLFCLLLKRRQDLSLQRSFYYPYCYFYSQIKSNVENLKSHLYNYILSNIFKIFPLLRILLNKSLTYLHFIIRLSN